MFDPLSDIITLLRPRAVFTRRIGGAGGWAVRYGDIGYPVFCTVIEGRCLLAIEGQEAVTLEAGDFVLLSAVQDFTLSGFEPAAPAFAAPHPAPGPLEEVRYGTPGGDPDVRIIGGHFLFDSPDGGLLVSQMPGLIHLRGADWLGAIVRTLGEEAKEDRAGRDLVLAHLTELLLIEALRSRSTQCEDAPTGLLRGLGDPRLAAAIRRIHGEPAHPWTIGELAKEAALSRSAFFDRFSRTVGVTPMAYVQGWRMSLAKDLLRREPGALAEVAERVGYGSAGAFSTAFARHVGLPPKRYMSVSRESGGV